MRKLPDGTKLTPPAVYGMGTTKNGVSHLLVFWSTPEGSHASVSSLSKWEWTETEVAVTPMVVIRDDGSGKPPVYTMNGETKRLPLRREGGRISYQHPLDPPFIVRGENEMTATLKDVFVDHWEKVE